MSPSRLVRFGNVFACTILLCTLALAADQKSPTKLSDLPLEDQRDISAALARELPGVQNFTLTASDGENGNNFGTSVAIDGNTVVVGAPFSSSGIGEAYVFLKSGSGWKNMTQTAKLTASDGVSGDSFGGAVSVSDNTIVVGAYGAMIDGNLAQGAAYVFVRPSKGWKDMTETAKLTASDGTFASIFGSSVSISGNTIAVGAPASNANNPNPGNAYVFIEPTGGWVNMTETAELTASDGTDYNDFGSSLAISGSTVVAGAYEDSCSCNSGPGAAYVFVEPVGGWVNMTETAKLTASDGRTPDLFGWSVSIEDNTAIVGAPDNQVQGAAYVFVEPANGWSSMTETAKLTAAKTQDFGFSVAQVSKAIVVGAPTTAHKGIAFVFLEPPSGWKSTSQSNLALAVPFTYNFDYFGSSVAASGMTAIVGAYAAPSSPPCNPKCKAGPGEAFVFVEQ
jgi:hypothetical protein